MLPLGIPRIFNFDFVNMRHCYYKLKVLTHSHNLLRDEEEEKKNHICSSIFTPEKNHEVKTQLLAQSYVCDKYQFYLFRDTNQYDLRIFIDFVGK